jgi:formylglycine-generating enzyme required for sulfatase activity
MRSAITTGGSTTRRRPSRHWLLLCACLLAVPASPEDLPLATRQKLLREQAIEAVTRSDVAALYAVMDEYRALEKEGGTVPAGLFFAEADAARTHRNPVRAEQAFNDYFRVAPPEGAAFAEASSAYGQFRQSIPESVWAILDGMVSVPGGAIAADADPSTAQDAGQVRVAPFSIAERPVSTDQFQAFARATGYVPAQGGTDADSGCASDAPAVAAESPRSVDDAPANCLSWTDATAYLSWLSNLSGLGFRLPTLTEIRHSAQSAGEPSSEDAAGEAGAASGFGEWVADCADPAATTVVAGASGSAAPCETRVIARRSTGDSATSAGTIGRDARESRHRATDVGFRLAL